MRNFASSVSIGLNIPNGRGLACGEKLIGAACTQLAGIVPERGGHCPTLWVPITHRI